MQNKCAGYSCKQWSNSPHDSKLGECLDRPNWTGGVRLRGQKVLGKGAWGCVILCEQSLTLAPAQCLKSQTQAAVCFPAVVYNIPTDENHRNKHKHTSFTNASTHPRMQAYTQTESLSVSTSPATPSFSLCPLFIASIRWHLFLSLIHLLSPFQPLFFSYPFTHLSSPFSLSRLPLSFSHTH